MTTTSFDETFLKNHPRYKKENGYLTALVEPICGMWGYTLWDHSTCVGGAKDWNWGRDDAIAKADVALTARAKAVKVTAIHREQDRYRQT